MKAVVVPAFLVCLLALSVAVSGNNAYTVVPAGAAGPGLFLDEVGPLLDGSENLPVVERLPRIARQPLWTVYEIGDSISGGCRLYDGDGRLVRSSAIIVELYRLTFTNPKTYYKRIYRDTRVRCNTAGIYHFSIPTDDLEVGFYQLRLGLPNGGELDPEFRLQVGDAVFTIEEQPPTDAI